MESSIQHSYAFSFFVFIFVSAVANDGHEFLRFVVSVVDQA